MTEQIQCNYCKMYLVGEVLLQKHIRTIHNQISIKEVG